MKKLKIAAFAFLTACLIAFIILSIYPVFFRVDWRNSANQISSGELTSIQFNEIYDLVLNPEPEIIKFHEESGTGQAQNSYYSFTFSKAISDNDLIVFAKSINHRRSVAYVWRAFDASEFPKNKNIYWWNPSIIDGGLYLAPDSQAPAPKLWMNESRNIILVYEGN
jgi:hypothetical protein